MWTKPNLYKLDRVVYMEVKQTKSNIFILRFLLIFHDGSNSCDSEGYSCSWTFFHTVSNPEAHLADVCPLCASSSLTANNEKWENSPEPHDYLCRQQLQIYLLRNDQSRSFLPGTRNQPRRMLLVKVPGCLQIEIIGYW